MTIQRWSKEVEVSLNCASVHTPEKLTYTAPPSHSKSHEKID